MKLGRTITKKTPLALFARKAGLSYKQIAECTGQSESSLKKAAAGIAPLTPKAASALARRFDLALRFLRGETKGQKVLRWDGEEWLPFDGSAPGTTFGYDSENTRRAIIQAIEDVATKIGYTLPSDEDQRAQIGYAVRSFNPFSTDAEIAAMSQKRQQPAKELKKIYELWNRQYPTPANSEQIDLLLYFEAKFSSFIQAFPGKADKGLMERFESLLVSAGRHPQGPLIAEEILHFLLDIDRRYKISRLGYKPLKNAE